MKNIHILPTDKPSKLYYNSQERIYQLCEFPKYHTDIKSTHNLYITSDEEIKEGDWVYYLHNSGLHEPIIMEVIKPNYSDYKPYSIHFKSGFGVQEDCKKIILTTDQELIKDGVQTIDDEFLKWFVKNPSCEEVEVKNEKVHVGWESDYTYEHLGIDGSKNIYQEFYKIIIPKKEPKQEEIDFIAKELTIEKERSLKQKTLEEALKEYVLTMSLDQSVYIDFLQCAEFGAKWQQEQILDFLYSEITERRDYSASKMCEKVIEFIENLKTK